jgi:hypothetical protein
VEKDVNHVQSSESVNIREINNGPKPQKTPVAQSIEAERTIVENDNETQNKAAAISRKVEHTSPQNGKEGEKKAVAPSVSSHQALPKAAALLVAQGVTPKRAREFAQLFDCEQIERNVALGLHCGKNNPPGYLLRLIQDDNNRSGNIST